MPRDLSLDNTIIEQRGFNSEKAKDEESIDKEISNNIEYILNNKEEIKALGLNGRQYLESNLTKEVSINKYKENILAMN